MPFNDFESRLPADATRPSHYNGKTMQVFDVLNDFLTKEALAGFYIGNVVKYVLRHGKKNGVEDLKKARVYLEKMIALYDEKST